MQGRERGDCAHLGQGYTASGRQPQRRKHHQRKNNWYVQPAHARLAFLRQAHVVLTPAHCCVAAVATVQCDPESMGDAYETESAHSERLESKVERVHLEWQALCCSYNSSHGKIVVLQDVWGAALAGEMQVRMPSTAAACRQQLWLITPHQLHAPSLDAGLSSLCSLQQPSSRQAVAAQHPACTFYQPEISQIYLAQHTHDAEKAQPAHHQALAVLPIQLCACMAPTAQLQQTHCIIMLNLLLSVLCCTLCLCAASFTALFPAGAAGSLWCRKIHPDGHPCPAQVHGQPEWVPAGGRPASNQQLHPQDSIRASGKRLTAQMPSYTCI